MSDKPTWSDKRPNETHFEWRARVARLEVIERDRSVPLVTPEAEQHAEYRDCEVLHIETYTVAPTRRNATMAPIADLYARGGITKEQFEAAQQIEIAVEILSAGVAMRGASLEARVDNSGAARDILIERVGLARIERAYTQWRVMLPGPKRMLIDMIVGTQPLVAVARTYGVNWRKARKRLLESLDRWTNLMERARRNIDADDLENAQKRVGGGVVL